MKTGHWAVISIIGGLSLIARAGGPSFQGIGFLPGDTWGSAYGVSYDGSVVIGHGSSPYRWTAATGITPLTNLGGNPGETFSANAISANGNVIVGTITSGTSAEIYRWTEGGGAQRLGNMTAGATLADAAAVSANGDVIVGLGQSSNGLTAFRWTADTGMVSLGRLPATPQSHGYAVSADGSVVAGTSGARGFRWTASGGMVDLGSAPGWANDVGVQDISADGSVIIGTFGGYYQQEGFRWTAATGLVELGYVPGAGLYCSAAGVTADGKVIVGSAGSVTVEGDTTRPIIWDAAHGYRNLADVLVSDCGLDLTGWKLSSAADVSGDGLTIVGTGTNPSGQTEGWVATLPEPGLLSLVGLVLVGLMRRRRK